MRLYYGRLLRAMRYSPAYPGNSAHFRLQVIDGDCYSHVYEAPTIDKVIAQVKADGHQVWGSDVLDYTLPPDNALEYILIRAEMERRGYPSNEIDIWFSLNVEERKALRDKKNAL